MNPRVVPLTPELEPACETFVRAFPSTMLYASRAWRNLLRDFLGPEDRSLVALGGDGEIVGFLPAFLKRGPFGPVLNSLPFYGSNGGTIAAEEALPVHEALLAAFAALARSEGCAASTLIASPLAPRADLYERLAGGDFRDERIGQVTFLPPPGAGIAERLMESYHSKTRNMVRKAEKVGIAVRPSVDPSDMRFLCDVHKENMEVIGGIAKPRRFYDAVEANFAAGRDYLLYVAELSGEPVAALLLFLYHRTVEYFTPVIRSEFRAHQPMSLLVHHAMREAVEAGYRNWNWGGTWLTQGGVYDFKKRWGTSDLPYRYYTRVHDRSILNKTKEELLEAYPYYYVVPFGGLAK